MDFGYQFALEGVRAAAEGDFEMASLLLEKAIGVSTNRSNYWTVLGNLSIATRRLDEAAGHFSRALQEDNDDLQAHLGLISIDLLNAGDSSRGATTLEQKIAEFGRINHVDALETVFLTAVIRADHVTVSELLKSTESTDRWDVSKHGAICHLVGRYFPFGLGLDAVVRLLPHLTINNLFVALFDVQRSDLSAWAASERPKIAIVNSQPKNIFSDYPIFKAIASSDYSVAYFMGQAATSAELTRSGVGLDDTYLLSGNNLADCNVDLIFSTSPQAAHLATRAAKVLIPHDIAGHPRGSSSDPQSMVPIPDYDLFDYFLTTNDRMAEDLALFVVENDEGLQRAGAHATTGRQRSARRLVPSGYPKLDYNIERIAQLKNANEAPSILVYPTDYTIHPGGMSPAVAHSVIDCLLRDFPNYQIIYRPHPNNDLATSTELQTVVEALQSEPRFEFNSDMNYLALWARGSVMVTDFSGGAMTYACTTGRPTLFFNPLDRTAQRAERGGILTFMNELGVTVEGIKEIAPAIRDLLDPANGWTEKIDAFRSAAVYNPGGAAAYIANNIPQLLADETPAGWTEL